MARPMITCLQRPSAGIERALPQVERRLENLEQQLAQAKEEAKRPFAQEAEAAAKL